ncbi:MAG TPA: hypothetical protein PLC48_14925, partial [Ferruginibacter sp.]|nr:hypothetical protein [Ferruginibacter sp.]
MKKNLFIISLILLAHAVSFGQPDNQNRLLKSVSSPRGNYIYLFDKDELGGKDSSKVAATDYFIIEKLRYEFTEGTKKSAYTKAGEARRVGTYKELQGYFSKSQVSEIKKLFGLKNDQEVVRYFNTHHFDREFPIIYDLIETRQALGQVFLDKDVKPGEVYMYKVSRVSKTNQNESWGFAVRQSHAANYVLPYFKPMIKSLEASDSLVSITWKMAIPGDALDKIPVPKSLVEADKDGAMVRIPFGMLNTRAKVFARKNNQFIEYATLMPVLNISKDTLTYTYVKKCMPEEEVTAYLVTEDEVYNQGISSDTAYAFAISNKIVPLIYGIRVKDVLDGVQLSWDKLPARPYVVGIEIRRTNSEDVEDSLATLPVSDTSFTDYSIKVGQHYRYKVKAIFLPLLGVEQKVPAEGIGTYTIFSRPLPPFDLVAENVNSNVQLKWDAVDEPSFYGYYIYRGTSSKQLDLVAGPVFTKTFLDSSG